MTAAALRCGRLIAREQEHELEGKVVLHDMCLRDGMHAKQHQIRLEEMRSVAIALDDAGVP